MNYDPERHHRRSVRLKDYDYASNGAYFVTLCTAGRICLFGKVRDGAVDLSEAGQIAHDAWLASEKIRHEVVLDEFIVMPNHVHGIILILDVGADGVRPDEHAGSLRPKSLSTFVSGFKSTVTRQINELRKTPDAPVWQRSFHDRVLRNEREVQARRMYIANNPVRWEMDEHYVVD